MNADDFPNLHAGKGDAYPCKEETRAIIGCAFEVLNELGHGLNEKLYENSLVVEFKRGASPLTSNADSRCSTKASTLANLFRT